MLTASIRERSPRLRRSKHGADAFGTMDAGVRVLVVGDGETIAPGLSRHVNGRFDLSVVGSAADVEAAIRLCATNRIDVVLVDLDSLGREGVDAIRRLRSECPEAKVIALTANEATELIVEALTAGASGYAQKSNGIERLAEVIGYAVGGEVVMPEADLVHVLNELHRTRTRSQVQERALERLTAREMDILRELAAGRGTGETAEVLGISPLTVQSHVKHILAKLGVHSKVEAVTLAWREGLAPIPPGPVSAARAELRGG
jgi:DNA-binding NarL/FixJ family response regulator